MIQIDNEFTVKVPAKSIWQAITEVDKYGDWNSFVSECKSSLVVGEAIHMRVHLFSFPIQQKETILEYQKEEILAYGVNLPFGLLTSTRKHLANDIEGGQARYRSEFRLQGILAPIVAIFMESKLRLGFDRMAEELRAEVLRRQNQNG